MTKTIKYLFLMVASVVAIFTFGVTHASAATQHNGTVDQQRVLQWFDSRKGNLTYSMYGSRNGADGTADCSGSMTQAIYEAGGTPYNALYSTETIHDYLLANNYQLVAENAGWNAKKGDIVVWGQQGQSAGAFGHIGVISKSDPNAIFISTCYYTGGQVGTAVQDLDYNYFASLDGYPYNYVYRYVGPKTPTKPTQAVQKAKTVHFNRTFEVSYYDYWNGKWDAINEGLSIPVTDYNNYIPLSAITMTDKHGKKLSNQYAQIGSPQREYFRMNGHYKVLHHYGSIMVIELAGEPVSIQSKYAVADK
ncbi:peptidoglycan amidohydrolase family protein [Leuconostoc fallax]|uniref:Bacteriophage lysin domain-containing protein n=1 Tax=Leuconostoc fallax TaxID=1251 RepID=A0A4R5N6E7_9LACO|nr:peptidoglycan amidohydrolase family protein [Leuconostoc fallax]MBU7456354.1 hypothetical protein [Leuconostoc fallax]TDG67228.1 hypothetical protein C5L23_000182 [Leuconostoc fallax]